MEIIGIAATASLIFLISISKGNHKYNYADTVLILCPTFKKNFIGDAKIELNISSTMFAGEATNGSCIFSGVSKPRYIRVRILVENDCMEQQYLA